MKVKEMVTTFRSFDCNTKLSLSIAKEVNREKYRGIWIWILMLGLIFVQKLLSTKG